MFNPITFCIASAKNEKEYTKLLIRSLQENTDFARHEVLIFIDSDNQNTYEELLTLQANLPNLKIYRNTSEFPIGTQRNVSIMFNKAKNDIVCYLQSDMVVGKDFDKHIVDNITEDIILSCARIEPPLHPESPEKIVKDFGLTPDTFDSNAFNTFVNELQTQKRPILNVYFAPFAIYKNAWIERLGGFDTQFRCSREDSDITIRMKLAGITPVQTWNACVYHFTCVSSRGDNWFAKTAEADYKNLLQAQADIQEMKRFIRKWGYFGHSPKPVYDISYNIELDHFADINILKFIEPHCSRMYLSDKDVTQQLRSQLEFDSYYYSNLRWNYTREHWNEVKFLFNETDFSKRICYKSDTVQGNTVISVKFSELVKLINQSDTQFIIQNIHEIIHDNEVGLYELAPFKIHIHEKNDISKKYIKCENIQLLLNNELFEFI